MKTQHSSYFASTVLIGALVSGVAQAAPRSTPVTVVNDAASPVPVTLQNPNDLIQFVGFSADTVLGDVGFLGMNAACSVSFGLNARMCNTKEVVQTPNLTSQPGVIGWVHPTIVTNNSSTASQVIDYTGLNDTFSDMTCSGWDAPLPAPSLTGVTLNGEKMTFSVMSCDVARPVACCQ